MKMSATSNSLFHSTDLLTVSFSPEPTASFSFIKLSSPILHTRSLPSTYVILEKCLPTIYDSLCFNDNNLPFRQEVLDTEIGHLFEHILLEYLCQIKILQGFLNASFGGETSWDWTKDPAGTFYITINSELEYNSVFQEAFDKSVQLLETIIEQDMQRLETVHRSEPYISEILPIHS